MTSPYVVTLWCHNHFNFDVCSFVYGFPTELRVVWRRFLLLVEKFFVHLCDKVFVHLTYLSQKQYPHSQNDFTLLWGNTVKRVYSSRGSSSSNSGFSNALVGAPLVNAISELVLKLGCSFLTYSKFSKCTCQFLWNFYEIVSNKYRWYIVFCL